MTSPNGYGITLDNVSKRFGDVSILNNVSLTLAPGEFVAIVGHSGCGKSTLLRMIAGLEQPTSGTIAIDRQPIDGVNPHVRVLFQEARLLPWRSVLDNVRSGSPSRDDDVARSVLAKVGLADKQRSWPGVLSGGQKQRVALARALVAEPRVLLLDEPLGALDALTRLDMQALIENVWLEQRFTGILVTHDVDEAVRLADRVIVMAHQHIALDVRIELSRPHTAEEDQLHYKKLILSKILHLPEHQSPQEEFTI